MASTKDPTTGDIIGSAVTGGLAGGLATVGANAGTTKTGTTNETGTSSSSGTQDTSSATSRTLTPYQSALQGPLFNYISSALSDPSKTIAPFQNQARNNVNSNYTGLSDNLRQQFMSTGGGSSGKFGTALVGGQLQRLGDLSNVDTQFAQTAAMLPMQAAGLGSNLLGMNFGQTTTGTNDFSQSGATTSNSTSTNTTKSNANPWLSALGTGLGIASKFL